MRGMEFSEIPTESDDPLQHEDGTPRGSEYDLSADEVAEMRIKETEDAGFEVSEKRSSKDLINTDPKKKASIRWSCRLSQRLFIST